MVVEGVVMVVMAVNQKEEKESVDVVDKKVCSNFQPAKR